jgi:ribose transport system permease protein
MADIALTSKPKARVRFAFLLNLTLLGLLLLMWALLSATTNSFMTANNTRTGVPGRWQAGWRLSS